MFVYLIQSIPDPTRRYIGVTGDLEKRLAQHNNRETTSTAEHRPWKLVTYLKFSNRSKAEKFEAYLKQGSGHTFARRHLW